MRSNGGVTVNVTKSLSRHIEGIVQCGQGRGERRVFEKVEMVNNQEIFAYNNLGDLFKSMEKAKWEEANILERKRLFDVSQN